MPLGPVPVVPLQIETGGSNRLPTWDPGVRGGIPAVAGKLVLTPEYIRQHPSFTAAVNAAIQEVEAPGAVLIPAQTRPYELTGAVHMRAGVVVRGEGVGETRIHANLARQGDGIDASGFYPVFSFQGHWIAELEVSAPISRGTQTIHFQPHIFGARPEIGQTILLTMENDPEHGWEQYVWEKRVRGQLLRVTGTTDTSITVDVPIRLDYSMERWPRIDLLRVLDGAGLEDLSLLNDRGTGANWSTAFWYATNCWMRNCEVALVPDVACWVWNSRWLTIEGCYIHDARNYGGGRGYGVNLCTHATDNLVTNNILVRLRHATMAHFGASGNVISYNDSREPAMSDLSLHGRYPYMNLFEGNLAAQAHADAAWGRAGEHNTFFRNRLTGHEADFEAQHGVDYVDYHDRTVEHLVIDEGSDFQNVVGNAMITGRVILRGCAETWVEHNVAFDPPGAPTIIQTDSVSSTIALDNPPTNGDTDDGSPAYFRASFYLSEPPPFWVTAQRPWPATGADVDSQGPPQNIPAADRYEAVVLRPARRPLRPNLSPAGPTTLTAGHAGTVRLVGWHPEAGRHLSFHVEWNDGTASATGLHPPGTEVRLDHTWPAPGSYLVRAQARDQYGLLSPWSRTVRFTIT